jgi:protein-arginine kinase activator protein McsA
MENETKKAICKKCGKEFEQSKGRGRPRAFCKECRPARERKVDVVPVAPAPVQA